MKTMKPSVKEIEDLTAHGHSLVGRSAKSTLVTELGKCYRHEITAFEIVWNFGEPELMVTLDGESVYETTLFEIV